MDVTLTGAATFDIRERLQYDLPRLIEPGTFEAGLHAAAIREVATSLSKELERRSQLGHFTNHEQQSRASGLAYWALEFYNMADKTRTAILDGKQVE